MSADPFDIHAYTLGELLDAQRHIDRTRDPDRAAAIDQLVAERRAAGEPERIGIPLSKRGRVVAYHSPWFPIAVVILVGCSLVFGIVTVPAFPWEVSVVSLGVDVAVLASITARHWSQVIAIRVWSGIRVFFGACLFVLAVVRAPMGFVLLPVAVFEGAVGVVFFRLAESSPVFERSVAQARGASPGPIV